MGVGPNKNSVDRKTGMPTYYGNMIKDGETSGRNFYFPETFAYARWRVDTKLQDETIDEYRLFNNLMSSMPMAFNLFHPLMMLHAQNPAVVDSMLRKAFPDFPIYKVKEIGLEFIPTPIERYTNNKSAMDAFIRFYDKEGGEYIIAIETKYTDSLGTNTASGKGVFEQQLTMLKNMHMLTEEGIQKIESGEILLSQIYRNFLLTERYREVQRLKDSYSIILAPEDHPTTHNDINALNQYLQPSYRDLKLRKMSLESFLRQLKEDCPVESTGWLEWFENRYLSFEKVE